MTDQMGVIQLQVIHGFQDRLGIIRRPPRIQGKTARPEPWQVEGIDGMRTAERLIYWCPALDRTTPSVQQEHRWPIAIRTVPHPDGIEFQEAIACRVHVTHIVCHVTLACL
jgi:hypothetical protein